MAEKIYAPALTYAVITTAVLSVVLAATRVIHSFSFNEPLLIQTSGAEYESLFAVWKHVHGMAVYNDRYQPPYSAAVYNWLFYETYGAFTAFFKDLLGLGDAWIPTIARFFTLLGALASACLAFVAFDLALDKSVSRNRLLAAAFALLVTLGPITGYWIFTVRPDVWAMAAEIAGAACFLKVYRSHRFLGLIGMALCAYTAWAFKQSSVGFLLAVGMFLLVRLRWRDLFFMVAVMGMAFAATFAVGESLYLKSVLFAGYPLDFTPARGLRNITNLAIKVLPVLTLLAAAIYCVQKPSWRAWLADDVTLFALFAMLTTGALSLPLSFQEGGSENYFFSFAFFLALASLSFAGRHIAWPWPSLMRTTTLASSAALSAAIVAVLAGWIGSTNLQAHHEGAVKLARCVEKLEKPIFIEHPYGQLPWMHPGEEQYVLSFVYKKERVLGRPYINDGIGGLIRARHFKSLVLNASNTGNPPNTFDGASLVDYQHINATCSGQFVLVR